MIRLQLPDSVLPTDYFRDTVDFIASSQEASGALPWFVNGQLDPWDHVEAAMGLTLGGRLDEARAAYEWLQRHQQEDGSWFACYEQGRPTTFRVESNFVAYVATGIWHYYLISGDERFVQDHWLMVRRAMDFVLNMQGPEGEIYWALDSRTGVCRDALLTGCSSIYRSLDCAICITDLLDIPARDWRQAKQRLGNAILNCPQSFDRTWECKAGFAMDWYYPVLSGLLSPAAASTRLNRHWERFVVDELGCRCIDHRPWVTVAESCELTLALLAAGDEPRARQLFSWLKRYREPDGSYWTGYVFPDDAVWPEERTTWTAAAVLLAADALSKTTKAASLFTSANPASNEIDSRARHRHL